MVCMIKYASFERDCIYVRGNLFIWVYELLYKNNFNTIHVVEKIKYHRVIFIFYAFQGSQLRQKKLLSVSLYDIYW